MADLVVISKRYSDFAHHIGSMIVFAPVMPLL